MIGAMNVTPVTVVATLRARPGQEAAVREALLALVPITRHEPGCLNYDLHQSPDHPGHFLFHETWETKQHLDLHLARPHIQEVLARADELFAEAPAIALWRRIL